MPKSAPSNRASANVSLVMGLVNIPLRIYTGTVSTHGLTKHEYLPVKEGEVIIDHPVGRGQIDKTTGDLIEDPGAIQRKVETEYGPVYVEDHEIEKLFTINPDTVVVKEFQPQHLFHQGNYVPKSLAYVEPQRDAKKKPMAVALKLLGTLLKGMKEEGVLAVCEVTTRGIPKPAILMPDGVLWYVYHTDAVREQRELPEVELNEAEVTMMRGLINTMHSAEVADLTDKRSELIQTFADEKAAAGDFGKSTDDYVTAAPAEPQVDLMAMLAASVAAAEQAGKKAV